MYGFGITMYTKQSLENRVDEISCWLQHHYPAHYLYKIKKQSLAYYTQKLLEMDEYELEVITA